jgi:hypothetical protein
MKIALALLLTVTVFVGCAVKPVTHQKRSPTVSIDAPIPGKAGIYFSEGFIESAIWPEIPMYARQGLHDAFNYGQYLADAITTSMTLAVPELVRLNEKPTVASLKTQGLRIAFIPSIDSAKCFVGLMGSHSAPIKVAVSVTVKMLDMNGHEQNDSLFATGRGARQSDGIMTNDLNEAIERATERATLVLQDSLAKRASKSSFIRDAMK